MLLRYYFSTPGADPFSAFQWDNRNARLVDASGKVVFEQSGIEAPATWSETAVVTVASKYFAGEPGQPDREVSVRGMITRIVSTIAEWAAADGLGGSEDGEKLLFSELAYLLTAQRASFNSPVWFNVGVHARPQCSACFILAVDDSLESLLELQQIEGRLFKFGSGTGTNLSTVRSSKEFIHGGGHSSGPLSFMRAYDMWANVIASAGRSRRAAKMQILNVSHPDIVEFVSSKAFAETLAHSLQRSSSETTGKLPQAIGTVPLQNANLSIRVSDQFMRAVESHGTFETRYVHNNEVCETLQASEVFDLIARSCWACGDPGLQFDDTINAWHTCPETGRINASNPCSEYLHLDNSACNLSSINLLPFLSTEGVFDLDGYLHSATVMFVAQETLIDRSAYPTELVALNAREFRQLGLGFTNLGAFLMCLGLPYDSDAAREWASLISALLTGQAYLTSTYLAEQRGAFAGYQKNRAAMCSVMRKHRDALHTLRFSSAPTTLVNHAYQIWDELIARGDKHGFRNSQATVVAPTGTISLMMDCDTTGIEPELALVRSKHLSSGGILKQHNSIALRALKLLGYSDTESDRIQTHFIEAGTAEGAPHLRPEHLSVFDCAFKPPHGARRISAHGHLAMMAAVQPFISGGISKTVNIPEDATVQEIYDIFLTAWRMGLKSISIYRDGSKAQQVISIDASPHTDAPRNHKHNGT